MAIRKADYHPKWTLIVRLIVSRSDGHCEHCGVQRFRLIRRPAPRQWVYATEDEEADLRRLTGETHHLTGKPWGRRRALRYLKLTYVHLEVAHLDRNRAHNRFTNLAALCQACHLDYDRPQHLRNRQYGRYHDRAHQLKLEL